MLSLTVAAPLAFLPIVSLAGHAPLDGRLRPAELADDPEGARSEQLAVVHGRAGSEAGPDVPVVHARLQRVLAALELPALLELERSS